MSLSEQDREALYGAGDHHPDLCDCDAYTIEQAFAEDCCCTALLDTFTAVEAIVARHVRAALAEAAERIDQERDELDRAGRHSFATGCYRAARIVSSLSLKETR